VVVHHFRAPTAPDNVGAQDSLRLHGMPHAVFSYGAHCACIEVDELTGRTRVDKYIAAHDCGTVLNPQILSQQIEGAIIQGIGFALHEELLCEDGRIMTPNLSTYIVPLMTDIPEIECIPVQAYEPSGPFGLKGAGEVGINGPLAAIGNALADACGVRLFNAPFTPERVHAAMKSTEGEPE
jgi:CO/xanthine dehydrogenase Mo-binding subunit